MRAIREKILVKLRDPDAVGQTLADLGLAEYHLDISQIRWIGINVPSGVDADDLLARAAAHPSVESAGFDVALSLCASPTLATDTSTAVREYGPLNWHHSRMDTYRAWRMLEDVIGSRGSASIRIGVVDTGYESDHPDMPQIPSGDRYWGFTGTYYVRNANGDVEPHTRTAGWGMAPDRILYWSQNQEDWQDLGQYREDFNGHGGMCLSEIGAPHNGRGVSGIAPSCRQLAFSTKSNLTSTNGALASDIDGGLAIKAWIEGADADVEILSCSFGWFGRTYTGDVPPPGAADRAIYDACIYVRDSPRTLMFAAAGNDGMTLDGATGVPAEMPGVIATGALSLNGGKIWYSNFGSRVGVVAPTNAGATLLPGQFVGNDGREVWQQLDDGTFLSFPNKDHFATAVGAWYWSGTGTSTATPEAAGAGGAAWSMNPALSKAQFRAALLSTVSPFLDADCEATYFPGANEDGFARGVVNAAKLTRLVQSTRPDHASIALGHATFLSKGYNDGQPFTHNTVADRGGKPLEQQTAWDEKDVDGQVRTRLWGTVHLDAVVYQNGAALPVSRCVIRAGSTVVADIANPTPGYALDTTTWPVRAPLTVEMTTAAGIVSAPYVTAYASPTQAVLLVEVTVMDGAATLAVSCSSAAVITVTCATGTVGAVPSSGASRQVTITGLAPGANEITIFDGVESLTVTARGAGLAVGLPADLAAVTFPFLASGSAIPGDPVYAYSDDSGELLGTVTADASTGAWSMQIGHA